LENDKPIGILHYIKNIDSFSNVTISLLVVSAERSFSKLMIIKTNLKSTMSQERLNDGLALLSIEK